MTTTRDEIGKMTKKPSTEKQLKNTMAFLKALDMVVEEFNLRETD